MTAEKRGRRPWHFGGLSASGMIAVAVLATTGCAATFAAPTPPPPSIVSTRLVEGYVIVPLTDLTQADVDRLNDSPMTGQFQCDARGAYADINTGSTIELTDTNDTVIATTTLEDGSVESPIVSADGKPTCSFRFVFPSVTIDQALYRIHVGDPSRRWYGFADSALRRGPIVQVE